MAFVKLVRLKVLEALVPASLTVADVPTMSTNVVTLEYVLAQGELLLDWTKVANGLIGDVKSNYNGDESVVEVSVKPF